MTKGCLTPTVTPDEFTGWMAQLGPFEPSPRLAAAVSGGADSMALAILAHTWARTRGGSVLALVVDHGLRPESLAEAVLTVARLAARGIASRLLRLEGLDHGPALAERARTARYAALSAQCATEGIVHLLLGHHALDQAETVLMRRQSGSGPGGLAGMPALAEQFGLRLVRPLLGVPPGRLRQTLQAAGVAWVEDPSNHDRRALRPRLRADLDDPAGSGPIVAALYANARTAGVERAWRERQSAASLADTVAFHPEGFALLAPGLLAPPVLAAVIQAVSGAGFPPPTRPVAALAAAPRPATLAGVRVLRAGRLGPGWLVVREAAAMEPRRIARPGVVWDGRFRLTACADPPPHATLGALGSDAAHLRRWSDFPSAVLQTLPALRLGNSLLAVPHLLYPSAAACAAVPLLFSPRRPAAGAPFLPDGAGEGTTGDAGRRRTPYVIL